MNIKPTKGHILLKPIEGAIKTKSGIHIAVKKTKSQKAKIVAMGEPPENYTSDLKVGDIVIHKMWEGQDCEYDGEKFLFVKYKNILAKEVK